MATNAFPHRRPRRFARWPTVVFSLLVLFRVTAQLPQYPFAPGVLDRIEVVVETYGGSLPFESRRKTTNVLAPNAAFVVTDSTFPNGQSFKIQHPNQPPVQPILDGILSFNLPAVMPARDISGVFQPSMPASVTFEGTWTKGNFNYAAGEAFSDAAARVILTVPQGSVGCSSVTIRTGAPIPVGVNPVTAAFNCDMRGLGSTIGSGNSDPLEQEAAVSGLLIMESGDGGANGGTIFVGRGATVQYFAVYKSRRRPEIRILQNTLNFAHTNGLPLPVKLITLTNTGGLPLTWTTAATNHNAPGGPVSWVKFTPASGTLASLGEQPLQVSLDTTGLKPGDHTAKVTISGDNWDGPKTFFVTLKLTAEQLVSKLEVTPASLEFFNRVALPQQTLTLSNAGPHLLEWFAPTVRGDQFSLFISPQAGSLNPGESRAATVTLLPKVELAVGQYTNTITFQRNGSSANTAAFPSVIVPVAYHVLEPQDELEILASSVAPSTNEPVLLDTEYTNFRANVTYQLGTRTDADLVLRLFDEEGTLQASSDFIRVSKSEGKVVAKRLTIPKVKIAPDASGKAPEKLILRAVLIDRALLTPIKSTSDIDHVYAVRSPVKLTLGRGATLAEFQPTFPAEVRAFPGRLDDQGDWPLAAVVELPKAEVPRFLTLTARLFRDPGLSKFFSSPPKRIPPGFTGRVILDLTQIGFRNFPDEAIKQRADFVQFRANVINANADDLTAGRIVGSASEPLAIPVERINLIAADPPFGTTLPRSEPAKIKLTAEYNVPNFGTRRINQLLTQDESGCVLPDHPLLQEGVLGPGRGQFTHEVTAFFPIISPTRTGFTASILMREPDGETHARDCDESHAFLLSDQVTLPTTPGQQAAAADATISIVSNSSAAEVAVSAPRKSLGAVTADDGNGPAAMSLPSRRASIRRHATEAPSLADVISLNQVWHFTPAIGAGVGFSADLSLTWTPEVVPDDPNLTEAGLKVISLNSSTGALRVYDTTLNLATRTATARVDSLEAYYTLGVIGPFTQRVVNLPLVQGSSGFTPRVIVNAGSEATALSLTAHDSAGQVIAGGEAGNPLVGLVGAGALSSLPVPGAFGILPQVPDGWLQGVAQTDAAALLLLERTNATEAVPALRAFPRLRVPGLEQSAARTTELRLANATRFANPLTLELRNDAGAVAGTFNTTLGPRNTLVGSLSEFFPEIAAGFSGYVTARGDSDLVAAALVQSASSLAVIEGQPLTPGTPARLVAPGVATGGANRRARIALVNSGAQAASVTLRLVDDAGANLGSPAVVNVAASQQYRAELGEAFGLNATTLAMGSLIVEGDVADMVAELTLLDPDASDLFRASQPLLGEPATRNAFAHFDNAPGRFTELSAYNPGANAALLTVTAFRADGSTVGSAPVSLAAGARSTRRLAELVGPSAGLAGGSLVIESSQPIFASALVGEDSLNTLSAIPPHAGQTVVPPEPPPLTFTVTPTQLVLSWPASATDFVLQSAPDLVSPINWLPVPNPVVTEGDKKTVTVDLPTAAGFFRLLGQ